VIWGVARNTKGLLNPLFHHRDTEDTKKGLSKSLRLLC
jgi:hypothetical protein